MLGKSEGAAAVRNGILLREHPLEEAIIIEEHQSMPITFPTPSMDKNMKTFPTQLEEI